MKQMPAIWETQDVILREIEMEDAECLVRWRSDPAVYQYFKSPRKITREEHILWYENRYRGDANRLDFIVRSKDGQALGSVGVVWKPETATAEVSYLIDPEFRGQGWAKKALAALCGFARTQWAVRAFDAVVHKQNIPSQKFIEAQGFVQQEEDGEFWVYRKSSEYDPNPGRCQ